MNATKTGTGWSAVGFGANMNKGEIVVFEQDQTNKSIVTAKTCRLVGHDDPKCDVDQTWTVLNTTVLNDSYSFTLTRKFPTTEEKKFVTINIENNDIIFAGTDSP